jgi:hypothetical protein
MASSLRGASDAALSEQILDAAQAETELHCQHTLRHASAELLDQSPHILIRQPIPHPPDPGSPAADAGVVWLSLSVASFHCTPASLLKAFLQVRAVRVTSDKLHISMFAQVRAYFDLQVPCPIGPIQCVSRWFCFPPAWLFPLVTALRGSKTRRLRSWQARPGRTGVRAGQAVGGRAGYQTGYHRRPESAAARGFRADPDASPGPGG